MSLLVAPESSTSAAADVERIGSALTAAHRAAAVRTTGFAPAAADEVSAEVAALFAGYGRDYQALSARASAFQQQFLQALASAAGSYMATEEAGVALLQQTGSAAATGVDAAINDVTHLVERELGIYNFRDWRGWVAFLLDYSWGFPGTALGYGLQVINHFTPNSNYDAAFSELVGSHVYRGGVGLPGFTTTLGNVTTHLGTGPGANDVMVNHEEVDVWQSRFFGPLFQTSYLGWVAGGVVVGTGYWLFHPNQDWFSLRDGGVLRQPLGGVGLRQRPQLATAGRQPRAAVAVVEGSGAAFAAVDATRGAVSLAGDDRISSTPPADLPLRPGRCAIRSRAARWRRGAR